MSRKNKLDYFEIKNIDNPCFVALAINLKKYFEVFKNQKGIRKGSRDTEFENFVGRIKSPVNFSQLNDKRFYFSDGIVSLPYGHQNLKEIDDFKKEKGQKNREIFLDRKSETIEHGKKSTKKYIKTLPIP